jgi:polar amino acid transport system substrate-binding protein
VDLANALARKLNAPLELVVYPNSGEVVAAGPKGEWDVAFMPEDAVRRSIVDFGPAYYLSTSTFLARGARLRHCVHRGSETGRHGAQGAG